MSLAETESEREQGLSGREFLPADAGMLFVFNRPGRYGFWMKGMRFPLDFIWINNDRVVDLTENVGVKEMNIMPLLPADKVVEVNAGFAARQGIKIGDKVSYEPVSN